MNNVHSSSLIFFIYCSSGGAMGGGACGSISPSFPPQKSSFPPQKVVSTTAYFSPCENLPPVVKFWCRRWLLRYSKEYFPLSGDSLDTPCMTKLPTRAAEKNYGPGDKLVYFYNKILSHSGVCNFLPRDPCLFFISSFSCFWHITGTETFDPLLGGTASHLCSVNPSLLLHF